MLWASGAGAEILRPMAAPVLGGILLADEVIDLSIPALFYWLRRSRWRALRSSRYPKRGSCRSGPPSCEAGPQDLKGDTFATGAHLM